MLRPKPCVLLCGFTGVGKTSIAQYYCGVDVVPDSAIGHGCATTEEFTYYSSRDLDIWDYRGFEVGESIYDYHKKLKNFAKTCYINNGLLKCPHIILYCIQGPGARVTNSDIDILKVMPLPTIVIVTKDDITRPDQRKGILNSLLSAGIPMRNIRYCSSEEKTGFMSILSTIKKLKPSAEKRLEELKNDCYIATQVFQSNSCSTVISLRSFRDHLLTPYRWGRHIVYAYYMNAPRLAAKIPSKSLRSLAIRAILVILAGLYNNGLKLNVRSHSNHTTDSS